MATLVVRPRPVQLPVKVRVQVAVRRTVVVGVRQTVRVTRVR
jgi:hypothetical protein